MAVLCLAACGRWGFSDQPAPDATSVDSAIDAPPDAPPTLLGCGQPTRFQVGASTIQAMAATGVGNGFALFTIDTTGHLSSWRYEFSGSTLAAVAENVALDSNANGVLGAASAGGAVVLAEATGRPTADGTTVYSLSATGSTVGQPTVHAGDLAIGAPVASNGAGTGLALATIPTGSTEIDARLVANDGSDAGAPVPIIDASVSADTVQLVPAGTGYAAVWGQASGSTHAIVFELLDLNLEVVAGPTIVDDLQYGAYRGHVVWASQSNEYLVSWHEKDVTGNDDVWFTILGPDGSTRVAPTMVATYSDDVVDATDGSGFWLTWSNYTTTPAHLDGAHIDAAGTVTARAVPMSGGSAGGWTMLARDGQPVLVWTEVGGSGPDLYFDPMCQ